MQKGQIRVQTENIFPIIKKFLYSEHEIFLRELVSNAVDASQKLTTLLSLGEAKGEAGELRIDVQLDAAAKTLTITDRGVGMSAEEVDKYINQVAFSGAEEFMQKYKDANIIGHFGLGFYSAFMVSDKVEIFSKSHTGAPGVYWSCDGSPEFELYEVDYDQRGTKIVLHINEESKEFLEAGRIKGILERFCKFLPVSIYFSEAGQEKPEEEKSINNTRPLWVQKPADLTKEDYEKFYRELYPFNETPLFWIHLNVDYPFNLTGILYFPKIKHSYEIQKDKIQLYCNQVFVTDEVANIVPEFLMLLQGVIDSPDIPLNVSRSYLQGDPNVKKINSHITKKVADKLDEIFRNERSSLEEKWESLGLFVKYGMMTDDKFMEKANKFLVMEEDNLIDKQEKEESVLTKEETEQLKELFKLDIPELHVTTEVKGLSVDSDPVIATRPEFMRRMKDMGAAGGGMTAFYAQMPDEVTLTVNGNHPIFGSLLKEADESLKKDRVRNLADLALLSQGLLKGNDLTAFIQRSVRMMQS